MIRKGNYIIFYGYSLSQLNNLIISSELNISPQGSGGLGVYAICKIQRGEK